MGLKRSLKGIDSENLETRIKSAVFLINNFPEGSRMRNDAWEELLEKLYEDAKKATAESVKQMSGIKDYDIKTRALISIVDYGNSKAAVAAVDVIAEFEDLWYEAQTLGSVIQRTRYDRVKARAQKALSNSVNEYAGIKHSNTRFYALERVAQFGIPYAAEIAYDIINKSEFSVRKIEALKDIANYGRCPEIKKKAVNALSESLDEIAAIKQPEIRASALKYVTESGTDEAAEKAYRAILRIKKQEAKESALRWTEKFGKLCVRKKVEAYLKGNRKELGEKLASAF